MCLLLRILVPLVVSSSSELPSCISLSDGMPAQHAHSDSCPDGIAHSTDLASVCAKKVCPKTTPFCARPQHEPSAYVVRLWPG